MVALSLFRVREGGGGGGPPIYKSRADIRCMIVLFYIYIEDVLLNPKNMTTSPNGPIWTALVHTYIKLGS